MNEGTIFSILLKKGNRHFANAIIQPESVEQSELVNEIVSGFEEMPRLLEKLPMVWKISLGIGNRCWSWMITIR